MRQVLLVQARRYRRGVLSGQPALRTEVQRRECDGSRHRTRRGSISKLSAGSRLCQAATRCPARRMVSRHRVTDGGPSAGGAMLRALHFFVRCLSFDTMTAGAGPVPGSRNRTFIQVPRSGPAPPLPHHAGDPCIADEKKPLRDASFKPGDAVELRQSALPTKGLVVRP